MSSVALATPQNSAIVTQAIVELTNYLRQQSHLPVLAADSQLQAAAQAHSQDMADANVMSHTIAGSRLSTLSDRAEAVHYTYGRLGENIAYNQADASSVVAAWMNSPPHRDNMMSPSFTDIGVGLAWNAKGEPYYTMMLGSHG